MFQNLNELTGSASRLIESPSCVEVSDYVDVSTSPLELKTTPSRAGLRALERPGEAMWYRVLAQPSTGHGNSANATGSGILGICVRFSQAPMSYRCMMHRRVTAVVILLVMSLQGPLLAYAAAPSAADLVNSTTSHCPDGTPLPIGTDCSSCCSHGSMPAGCMAACAVPMATPNTFTPLAMLSHDAAPPTSGGAPFIGRDPTPLIRPPIA